MAANTKMVYEDVFCIPHRQGQYLIYFPLKEIVLSGNAGLVNLVHEACSGDEQARARLGVSENFFANTLDIEKRIRQPLAVDALPPFAPTNVSLFLTNNCPLRCLYCYADGGKNKLRMPWDTVTGVLDEVLENVLASGQREMTVNFHGGGDVTSAWQLLVRTRAYVDSITASNGIRARTTIGLSGVLSDKQREWIVRNIDSATVSLDGGPEDNKLRPLANGKPSFPIVHETLKYFDRAGFGYGLRCTITESSVSHIGQIVRFFCENYGAKNIKIEPMFPAGRADVHRTVVRSPSAVAFVKHYRSALKAARSFGKNLIYSGARINTLSSVFCQAAGESCAVTPEGWITSCYEVLSVDDPLAAVFFYGKYNPELRKVEIDEELRKNLFELNVLNKSKCKNCFCKWHCAGDCPAKSIKAEDMLPDEYPDRCYINRELTKDQLLEALKNE